MARTTTLIFAAIAFVCGTAAATPPPVTVLSPCECRDNHRKAGLGVKTDSALPPTDASAIQAVTPSDMFSWPEPEVRITTRPPQYPSLQCRRARYLDSRAADSNHRAS